ncbi:MAG: hypothetical protein IJK31_03970 [Ruminococcus sp.]|nr:hypothetical protein [Ruminococcus sp.]
MNLFKRITSILCSAALTACMASTTAIAASDNYCDKQDNIEAKYDGSYWKQPSYWLEDMDPGEYNGNGAEIKIDKLVIDGNNAPGSIQTVKIRYCGPDENVSTIGFHIYYDTRLELKVGRGGHYVQDAHESLEGFETTDYLVQPGEVFVTSSSGGNTLYSGDMYSLEFVLPLDVKSFDVYPIGIGYKQDGKRNDLFLDADATRAGKLHMAYVFAQGIENGYIKVGPIGSSITNTATTTTVKHTTTTTTTTKSVTTTTSTTTTKLVTTTTTTQPEPVEYDLGDVNNDGTVDGSDATIVLREFGNVLAGKGESFTPEQFKAGDVDQSGVIDGSDATLILKFFGEAGKDIEVSYGGMQKWMDETFWHKEA